MPEAASEKHIAEIPRFVLPPEFSNDKPAAPAAEVTPPPTPAATPEPESKPAATEAVATPPVEKEEPGKETTEKVPARLQKRIDRATKLRYEAETRAETLARENAELKARPATPTADPSEPKMSDYTDIAEYGKAMREYGEKKKDTEQATKQREESSRKFQQDITSQWVSQVAKAEVEFDDWDEVVGDLKPTAPWAVALMQEENGYKIAHYLGTHDKEAQRITSLNPYAQIREIAKLAIKLQTPPAAPQKPSAAPPPIQPVAGGGQAKSDSVRPNQPYEEYQAVGNKLFRGRR